MQNLWLKRSFTSQEMLTWSWGLLIANGIQCIEIIYLILVAHSNRVKRKDSCLNISDMWHFCRRKVMVRVSASHWHDIRICICFLGCFFAKFGIAAISEFSSEMKEPKLHRLGVFWANYCKNKQTNKKKPPNFTFLSKLVQWWVGNWVQKLV